MEEIACTHAENACTPGGTIVLDHCAQSSQSTVLPEIDVALNLEVASVDSTCAALVSTLVCGCVVVVNEEESVAPAVSFEHFERGCSVTASEVVEGLDVGLGTGRLAQRESCRSSREKE